MVTGLVRAGKYHRMPSTYEVLCDDDILLVEAASDSLKRFLDVTLLRLAAEADSKADAREKAEQDKQLKRNGEPDKQPEAADSKADRNAERALGEAIMTASSSSIGTSTSGLALRERHGVNILAVARQGQRLQQRLGKIRRTRGVAQRVLSPLSNASWKTSGASTCGEWPSSGKGTSVASGIIAAACRPSSG